MTTRSKELRLDAPHDVQRCRSELAKVRLREYLSFDSFLCRKLVALLGIVVGYTCYLAGRTAKAFHILSAVHRAAYSEWASKFVERWLNARARQDGQDARSLAWTCARHVEGLTSSSGTARFHDDPARLLGSRVLVLKSPAANEKGVLLIDYTFALPLFAKCFDLTAISRQYHIVLEPSWSGYCDLDILCYAQLDAPVFIQAPEPRDALFLRRLGCSFVPVPLGDNWWVDHRVFRPLPGVAKDVDVVMIGSWGRYKRHHSFFAALAELRARGAELNAILLGYPGDYTREDILRQAQHYHVDDQLEIYERLSAAEVNEQLNRARVNLVWSRREGCNRSSIEGMFAGVPCILREGFNYGQRYAHINPQTGSFSSERDLPDRLLWAIQHFQSFSPHQWVLENMSCQRATAVLENTIRETALARGENWTRGLAVKVTYVDRMQYWNEDEAKNFAADIDCLRAAIRK